MDDAVTFTLFDGETLSLSAAETAELASVAGLAQLFNVKAEAAGIAVTASGTEAGGLVLTADVAKVNVNAAASVVNGTVNAGNALTVDATTTATGADGGVMGADLSAYLTLGANAQGAGTIAALDVAIAGVASQRADFGAWMNRLEHTVDNLTQTSQNTSAARSGIADADYAAETSELARTQIIAQAATAMLSQANQQAQSVLALLK
jgi:flagellin